MLQSELLIRGQGPGGPERRVGMFEPALRTPPTVTNFTPMASQLHSSGLWEHWFASLLTAWEHCFTEI